MNIPPTLLVTGGTGLVGRAIQELKLDYNCCFLSSKDCDLTDYDKTRELFEKWRPDYVIHLAANVGGLYKNMNNKVEMLEKNVLININVIRCCREFRVKRCIACLSTCIFPDKVEYPIKESMLHNGEPHWSNNAYAYAKRLLEVQCRVSNGGYTEFICVIPTNVYGPHDNFSLEDGHVIPALIHKCYLSKKNNEVFEVRGSGKPMRQFIYSKDLARLIMWVMERYELLEPVILASMEEVSIGEVASIIASEFEVEKLEYDMSYEDGQYKKTASNRRLMEEYKKVMGEEYKFKGIREGLRETIEWFKGVDVFRGRIKESE